MKVINKRTRHLLTISIEHVNESNIEICPNSNQDEYHKIPQTHLSYFKSLLEETGGLFVHSGFVKFKNQLKNTFNEFDYLKGRFTDFEIIWVKLVFDKSDIVTFFSWVDDQCFTFLLADDGSDMHNDFDILNREFSHEIQLKAFEKAVYMVRETPLPFIPHTYYII